jgi:hypothetical protein
MNALAFSGETVLKTILITGSIGMVVGFTGTLLTLFGGGSIRVEYLEVRRGAAPVRDYADRCVLVRDR